MCSVKERKLFQLRVILEIRGIGERKAPHSLASGRCSISVHVFPFPLLPRVVLGRLTAVKKQLCLWLFSAPLGS